MKCPTPAICARFHCCPHVYDPEPVKPSPRPGWPIVRVRKAGLDPAAKQVYEPKTGEKP